MRAIVLGMALLAIASCMVGFGFAVATLFALRDGMREAAWRRRHARERSGRDA